MTNTGITDPIVTEINTLSALYAIRNERAARLKEITDQIDHVEALILTAMNAAGITSIGREGLTALIKPERVYKGENWELLYQRIRRTGEFDLLHRRLSIPAIRERELAGDMPQGVVAVNLQKLVLKAGA